MLCVNMKTSYVKLTVGVDDQLRKIIQVYDHTNSIKENMKHH